MILRGSVFSKVLGMDTGLTVITPYDHRARQPYRSAYLLHGLYGSHGNWADYTKLPVYALELDAVMIMPEVGRSFYADMRHGQKFFTYVADELPEICKNVFNISARREDTAVIGGSMGGYGALKCALSRPEQYGKCCAFASACLFLKENIAGLKKLGDPEKIKAALGEQLFTDFEAILGETFAAESRDELLELAAALPPGADKPDIYAACGTDDEFLEPNRRFSRDMAALGFAVTYEEWQGEHDWNFFDQALEKGLRFCFGEPRTDGHP